MKKCLITLLFASPLLLFVPVQSSAETVYIDTIDYTLEQPFAGEDKITSSSQYFNAIYRFALGIVGIIAVILIMFGGLRWMAAAGNESIITEAKEIVTSAVIGLVIALLSYVILAFINPQILIFGFAPAKINIVGVVDLWSYDWCSDATFADLECSSNAGTTKCAKVACGATALSDGAVCRGAVCLEGTGGCYHVPSNPTGAASCQEHTCGAWIEKCYNKYADDETRYKACLCDYYPNYLMKKDFDAPVSTLSYSEDQTTMFTAFCNEDTLQAVWVGKVATDEPYKSAYAWAGAMEGVSTGFNCGFSCAASDVVNTSTDSGDGVSAGSYTVKECLPA